MSFIESLNYTINNWMKNGNEDEWLFEKFRETEIDNLEPYEAFDFINEVIPILLNEANSDIWTELFETIISLAHKSNTTEIPNIILENWEIIKSKSELLGTYDLDKLYELANYYRIEL